MTFDSRSDLPEVELVEDEGEVRALARDILQARGYTVLERVESTMDDRA